MVNPFGVPAIPFPLPRRIGLANIAAWNHD